MRLYCPMPAGRWTVGESLGATSVSAVAPATTSETAVAAVTDRVGGGLDPARGAALFDAIESGDTTSLLRELLLEHVRRDIDIDGLPSRFAVPKGYDTPVSGVTTPGEDVKILVVLATTVVGPFYPGHLDVSTPAELLAGAEAYWEGVPAGDGPREFLLTEPAPIVAIEAPGDHVGE